MKRIETNLEGCFLFEPNIISDARGYFFESYRSSFLEDCGLSLSFVQDNESKSQKGVLRGLHYQIGDYAQSKLVRVIKGSVLDVAVDLRPESRTFGQHFKIELSEENKLQLLIPKGFAHGFLVLENDTIFSYKCDSYYHKDSERGIIFNDRDLGIDWGLSPNELILSEKDKALPKFSDAEV